jgi:hypothetical protein
MRTILLLVLVLILAGAAVFGFYKALELTEKNAALGFALAEAQEKVTAAQRELTSTQSRLSDMLVLQDQLTGEVDLLKGQVVARDKKIAQFRGYARLAKDRIVEVSEANMTLVGRHREMTERMMRLSLENEELRARLSSPDGLKRALKELRTSRRARPERPRKTAVIPEKKRVISRPAARPTARPAAMPTAEPAARPTAEPVTSSGAEPAAERTAESSDGNEGYLIREGRSTFFGVVDIEVRPAELLSINP